MAVAGNERATDDEAEDDSASHVSTRTATSAMRKTWPGEVCQGGSCAASTSVRTASREGGEGGRRTHLGGDELLEDGKDGLERHARIPDRERDPPGERDPPSARLGLALVAEALEERDEFGCEDVEQVSLRSQRKCRPGRRGGRTERERDVGRVEALTELRHLGGDGVDRILGLLFLRCRVDEVRQGLDWVAEGQRGREEAHLETGWPPRSP